MSNLSSPATTLVSSSPIIEPSPFVVNVLDSREYYKMDKQEDLASDAGLDCEDDMGDLSDSPSSHHSSSRPTTPQGHTTAHVRTRSSASPPVDTTPFAIAQKAERILGLTPGTLPHAHAALENARDEVRRTAELSAEDHAPTSYMPSDAAMMSPQSGMRRGIDRAKKAMSATFPSNTKVVGVVVGAGGREEEKRRERRRRAADGVIYWQKEVARLEAQSRAVGESRPEATATRVKKARR